MTATGAALLARVELDPLHDPRWPDLLERAGDATAFHHSAWLALVHGTYGYDMTACCVTGDDGRLLAGLPVARVASRLTGRRLVAVPFSDLCPPLVACDAPPKAGPALVAALRSLQERRGLPLEVRGTGGILGDAAPGMRYRHHVLALGPDVAAVERRFAKPQIARGVRRARREGLHAAVRVDRTALATFYRLHVATRRRLGVPTQPRGFVMGFERLFAEGIGFVLEVRHEERVIAAAVFLTAGDTLLYKYGASDERFLGLRPNNLLFMEAIRWGCEHGKRRLDFGRTDWDHESLRAFKLAWGAEELELQYRHLGGGAPGWRSARNERVLASIIRRSPPTTGRVLGEVLYRHAG